MLFKIFFIIGLGIIPLFAGDNSQATLGDMKEAIYKLIIQNKHQDAAYSNKQTKLDDFIKQYVKDNKEQLIIKK